MAQAKRVLPATYYKRPRQFAPLKNVTKKWPAITIDGKKKGVYSLIYAQLAPSLVESEKYAKADGVTDNYRQLRKMGHFQEKYAMLVDGSPTRPLRNVSFLGSVVIQDLAGKELIVEAAQMAMRELIGVAGGKYGLIAEGKSRTNPYKYIYGWKIELDMPFGGGKGREISLSELANLDAERTPFETITIYNSVPYAGKIERWNKPNGIVRLVWQRITKTPKYVPVGTQYHYLRSHGTEAKTSTARRRGVGRSSHKVSGRPVMVPAITFGEPSQILTKASPIGKMISK